MQTTSKKREPISNNIYVPIYGHPNIGATDEYERYKNGFAKIVTQNVR
jgi:hypothetical protein